MDKKELVTIVTLTYNSKNLKPTIDSVLAQDYPYIQYIISDDCSTNLDLAYWKTYIESHKEKNIIDLIIVKNEVNLGTTKNFNKAYSCAKGKYIFCCSHDDCLFDAYVISDWVNEFDRTQADVITAKRAVFNDNTHELLYYMPSMEEISFIRSSPSELFDHLSTHKNFIYGASTARTRESLIKYGFYDERYPFIEDYPSNLKLARLGAKIAYYDRVVLKYNLGGISSATISKRYIEEETSIVENEILPYCDDRKEVLRKHRQWIIGMTDGRKASYLKEQYGKHSFRYLSYRLCMIFKHPIYIFEMVCQKMNKYN